VSFKGLPRAGSVWRVRDNDPDQPAFVVTDLLFIGGVPWLRYRQQDKPDEQATTRAVSEFVKVFEPAA
jgi:hypothetical protein